LIVHYNSVDSESSILLPLLILFPHVHTAPLSLFLPCCCHYHPVPSIDGNIREADDRLMSPKFPLLPTLAAHIAFEICIGLNGKIWFKSTTISEGIALKRILEGVDSGELEMEKGTVERALREYMA
jgi:hypothetical protein